MPARALTVPRALPLPLPLLAALAADWWNDPEAGHGLLLFPVACWLAFSAGMERTWRPAPWAGGVLLAGAVGVRFLSELAAELFTMRLSLVTAAAGLLLWYVGWRQLRRWWLAGCMERADSMQCLRAAEEIFQRIAPEGR